MRVVLHGLLHDSRRRLLNAAASSKICLDSLCETPLLGDLLEQNQSQSHFQRYFRLLHSHTQIVPIQYAYIIFLTVVQEHIGVLTNFV